MTPQQRKSWSLAKLRGECGAAPAVWIALIDLAAERESNIVTPTREQIAEVIGINRVKTISTAFTVLEKAGWIERAHIPVVESGKRTATLLRLVLCRKGRKTPSTAHTAVRGEKRPKCKGRKTPQDFPYGKAGVENPAAAPSDDGRATRDARSSTSARIPLPVHPSARIEQEKLAAIRRSRRSAEPRPVAAARLREGLVEDVPGGDASATGDQGADHE